MTLPLSTSVWKIYLGPRGGSSRSKGLNHKATSGGLSTQLAPCELEILKEE